MTESATPHSLPMPAGLRRAIEADLHPVVPLAPPLVRVAAVAPIALFLLVGAALVFGVRGDALRLGWILTWGASSVEMTLGLTLVAAALREAVPGTTLSRRALTATFAAAMVAIVAITWLTWSASPTRIVRDPGAFIWRVCVGGTTVSALPALFLSGWLVARGFPLRPRLAGALYGLGAGLMADAGWRIFCHFSEPAHVFGTHTLAVGITTIVGAVHATIIARRGQ
jgi:hypothetical protein